ncbi:GTP-binding protein [Phytohabitans sp. ZYX-F-186]|uniref:GTP-binding protein n=1 Tax=Phytohabitans maris TaxID=3071409 RepID=A0ABU0ZSK3_9ACTN|nr:GTP-binding protein [Phytohabitans sp. ZYX-F-186]MDQ7909955.1 GTP-binding protein [Phytohabitans sp. ZYX-F-186]
MATAAPVVTVLSGLWPGATYAVARALLAADPSLLLVRYDLTGTGDGYTCRVMCSGTGATAERRGALLHGDMSRTLRDEILPTVARLARTRPYRQVVLLPPAVVEPESVAAACTGCVVDGVPLSDLVRVDSYVTVVHGDFLLDALNTGDDLVRLGIPAGRDDHRALAEVAVRQIEYADTLVLWGSCAGGPFDTAQVHALLHHLAPWAAHLRLADDLIDATGLATRLLDSGRHRPDTPGTLARGVEGFALGVHDPTPSYDVVSAVFRACRPFHPQRLHETLDAINTGVLRSRGHLWLASQPHIVVTWEFAGGRLTLGALGRWQAATPEEQRHHFSDRRRLAASVEWHPYYDDRHHYLVFIGVDLDPAALHRALTRCLLTDAELADGPAAWRTYTDPFAGRFTLADALPMPAGGAL